MANVEVNDLASKATPVPADEAEIQETAGGTSKKVTLKDIQHGFIHARGQISSAGVLENGSIGVTSVAHPGTGEYDITLNNDVTAEATAMVLATTDTFGAVAMGRIQAGDKNLCEIETWSMGSGAAKINSDFSFIVFDEA